MLDNDSLAMNNVPLRVKNNIHAINMFDSYSIMSWITNNPSVANTLKKFFSVEFFWMNSLLNTTMIIIIPLDFCFENIQLVMLTTCITQTIFNNGKLTCERHIMKIRSIRVFTYLTKIQNWVEWWIKTIVQNGSLIKLSGSTSE